jgi:hypothetical protein
MAAHADHQDSPATKADGDWVSLGALAATVVSGLMLRRAGEVKRRVKGEDASTRRRRIAAREGLGSNLE